MLALLYDVHGNLPALDAVLADARARGADRWLLGGDYALFGPEPEGTVEALRALEPAMWLRGNGERWCAWPGELPDDVAPIVPAAVAACREALGATLIGELGDLPEQGEHDGTCYVHASPVSDVRSFLPKPAPDEDELLAGVDAPRLVFGHTHLPFRRISARRGTELVNPGSVGLPYDHDQRASYALVHDDRSIEPRRIPYDHQAAADRMRERWPGEDWADTVARRIEQARGDA